MRIIYDDAVDVLRIFLWDRPIEESDELTPGVIADYDKDGKTVALEFLDASHMMENPRAISYGFAELK